MLEQKKKAEEYKIKLDKSGAYNNPIVTEITAFSHFYAAENYHQDYYRLHGNQPYCTFVIRPESGKIRKVFKDKLKPRRSPETSMGVWVYGVS